MNMQKKNDQDTLNKKIMLTKLRHRTVKRPVLFHRIGNRHR